MSPAVIVQRQLDAYNAKDMDRFLAQYEDQAQLFKPPQAEPFVDGKAAMRLHYASKRFNIPSLHADLIGRMTVGPFVFEHERVHGLSEEPQDVVIAFQVVDDRIRAAWFYGT